MQLDPFSASVISHHDLKPTADVNDGVLNDALGPCVACFAGCTQWLRLGIPMSILQRAAGRGDHRGHGTVSMILQGSKCKSRHHPFYNCRNSHSQNITQPVNVAQPLLYRRGNEGSSQCVQHSTQPFPF